MFPSNAGIFQSQLVNGFETGPIKEKSTNSNFFPHYLEFHMNFFLEFQFFSSIFLEFNMKFFLEFQFFLEFHMSGANRTFT